MTSKRRRGSRVLIAVLARLVVRLRYRPACVLVLARVKLGGAGGTAYGCLGRVLGAKPSRPVVVGRSVLALVAEQFGCRLRLLFERGERGVALAANEAAAGAGAGVNDWLFERDRALVAWR